VIRQFKITFGKGAFLADINELKASMENLKRPEPKKLEKTEEIIKTTETYTRENTETKPVEFEDEF
jgi:hypothetical protein